MMDGIAYGTPQLICPGKVFERRFNAEAATRNGVGMSREYGQFDVGAVHDAIERLIDGRKGFQEAASVLRSELAVLGGATRALEVMESRVG